MTATPTVTKYYRLGHRNLGQLTTNVPHANTKTYHDGNLDEAWRDCEELQKLNPQMRVLSCTRFGTPLHVVTKGTQ